jgi:hypothetical protein
MIRRIDLALQNHREHGGHVVDPNAGELLLHVVVGENLLTFETAFPSWSPGGICSGGSGRP